MVIKTNYANKIYIKHQKQKNHLPLILQTEFARKKKKVSRLKYNDRFITIHRWTVTVGKWVGEMLKYRLNISVCKFIGKLKYRRNNSVRKSVGES